MKACRELKTFQGSIVCLLNTAVDGLEAESKYVDKENGQCFAGISTSWCIVDCNHNAKSLRYQIIGGSCALNVRVVPIDPGLLQLTDINEKITRVKDYASDGLVLRLCDYNTLSSLVKLSQENPKHVAALCLTLFFVRLKLYAINSLQLDARCRISFLWSSLVWLTSLQGMHSITQRNLIREIISSIFTFMREECLEPRFTTSEPIEHKFGDLRSKKREFTTSKYIDIVAAEEFTAGAIETSGFANPTSLQTGYRGSKSHHQRERDSIR